MVDGILDIEVLQPFHWLGCLTWGRVNDITVGEVGEPLPDFGKFI